MKKMRSLIIIIAAAALIAVGFPGARLLYKETKATVSATFIVHRLRNCSSLTTASLVNQGIINSSVREKAFISINNFSMLYDAQLKPGIDLSHA